MLIEIKDSRLGSPDACRRGFLSLSKGVPELVKDKNNRGGTEFRIFFEDLYPKLELLIFLINFSDIK